MIFDFFFFHFPLRNQIVKIIPFRKTVEQIAIQIPFNPNTGDSNAARGILSKFTGKPPNAGGSVSPAPENAPLNTTSAAEKIKITAVILLKSDAALITFTSSVKKEAINDENEKRRTVYINITIDVIPKVFQASFSALSALPAPIFCPTSIVAASENPIVIW